MLYTAVFLRLSGLGLWNLFDESFTNRYLSCSSSDGDLKGLT